MTGDSSSSADSARIGWAFLSQYYSFLNRDPARLHCFYTKRSTLIHSTEGEEATACYGQQAIHNKIMSLGFEDCKVYISNVDSQGSAEGGIIVQVIGEMSNNGGAWRKFAQTFFLAEQPNGFFVLNDIFRNIKEEGDEDEVVDVAAPVPVQHDLPVPSATDAYEPAFATPKAEPTLPAAAPLHLESALPIVQEQIPVAPVAHADPVTNGIHHHTAEPSFPSASSSPAPLLNGDVAAIPVVVAATPVAPAPAPAPAAELAPPPPPPAVVAAQVPAVETPAAPIELPTPTPAPVVAPVVVAPTPAVTEPTPAPVAVAAPAPTPIISTPAPSSPAPLSTPTPKTWASLAAKDPTKWGSQAVTSKGVSSAAPPAPSPGQAATSPAGAAPAAADRPVLPPLVPAVLSIMVPSCFVKGVVETVSEKNLRDLLETRFGALREVDIIRSKACAFVEFERLDSARRAIQASLRPSEGGEGGLMVYPDGNGQGDMIHIVTRKPPGERPISSGTRGGRGGASGAGGDDRRGAYTRGAGSTGGYKGGVVGEEAGRGGRGGAKSTRGRGAAVSSSSGTPAAAGGKPAAAK